jgi:hypothetical protein
MYTAAERAELKDRDKVPFLHYCWRGLNGIYLPVQLNDWLSVVVALLFIGLSKISLTKSSIDQPSLIESPLRLQAQKNSFFFSSTFVSSVVLTGK